MTERPKLIILRGNSGSGKSSIARELRLKMGYGTALVEQDYIRRILLREREKPNLPNIELIDLNVRFALGHGYNVVLEGIFNNKNYGEMLRRLVAENPDNTYVYYFDISLEETLRRHETKPNSHEFGEELIRELFTPKDFLGIENERTISESATFSETLERIYRDIS